MTIRNTFLVSAALLVSAAAAGPALAQAAPAAPASFSVGAKVSDTAGGSVGTITKVDGGFVILKTNKHEVRLPKASFTAVDDGFIMAMTQAQVNAAVEQTLAKADNLLTVGAMVRDTHGGFVGSIQAVDDQFATVKLASNNLVKLPVSAFGPGASGPVIAMTAAELDVQASAATAAATPAADAGANVAAEATTAAGAAVGTDPAE